MKPTEIAEAYYTAFQNKDLAGISEYLDSNVEFIGSMAEFSGKEAVLEAAKNFFHLFNSLSIRKTFGSEDQAMIVLDFEFPQPIGHFRASVLMTIKGEKIARLEFFYDTRVLEQKKEEIFS